MLETTIGVFGGLVLFSLLGFVLEIPEKVARNRKHREMKKFMETAITDLTKHLEENRNAQSQAKQGRKGTAKAAGSRAKATGSRSQAGQRNAKQNSKVRSGTSKQR